MVLSLSELKFLIKFTEEYEPEIVKIIEKFMTTYTFKTKEELKEAVDMWCNERDKALKMYKAVV